MSAWDTPIARSLSILSISPDTVKFHLHNVLLKYEVKSRSQLQQLLEDWDFSRWDRQI